MKAKSLISICIFMIGVSLACGTSEPPVATETPVPTVAPSDTPVPEPTATKPKPTATLAPTETPVSETLSDAADSGPELVDPPSPFTIGLVFEADAVCGYDGFAYDYFVTLSDDSISMLQVAAGITTSGPYDAETGAFTASLGGLPGTEIYTGVISATATIEGGSMVYMTGDYTYTDDPNLPCEGLWPYAGEVAVP